MSLTYCCHQFLLSFDCALAHVEITSDVDDEGDSALHLQSSSSQSPFLFFPQFLHVIWVWQLCVSFCWASLHLHFTSQWVPASNPHVLQIIITTYVVCTSFNKPYILLLLLLVAVTFQPPTTAKTRFVRSKWQKKSSIRVCRDTLVGIAKEQGIEGCQFASNPLEPPNWYLSLFRSL